MHNFTPLLFLVVGSPGSGKDELMTAVNTIGSLHAEIVPKHTNRMQHFDDGEEMIRSAILFEIQNKHLKQNSLKSGTKNEKIINLNPHSPI